MPQLLRGIDIRGLLLRHVDAKEQVVGRLAAQIAMVLQGKDKPTYCANKDMGDVVVVTNARHVVFTGRKWDQKLYRWHTGFPGSLKERTARDQFSRMPEDILWRAVYGMLPKNRLRQERARKLRIFLDDHHPFVGHPKLVSWQLPARNIRIKEDVFEIPEGFVPLNLDAYRKRYAHVLPAETLEGLLAESTEGNKIAALDATA